MTEQKPFRVETNVDAPLDAVWLALTTPERIREWFGYDYPGIDEEIRVIFDTGAELTPSERLTFDDGSSIELIADGPRTIVRAVMPGPLADAEWEDLFDAVTEGWRTYLEQLRFLLETSPAGRRRTIYLTGEVASGPLLEVAGAGEPRHDGRRQRTIVNADGHLVVAAADHALTSGESGPANILISTYGLDDAAFAGERDRWAARWHAVAKNSEVTT